MSSLPDTPLTDEELIELDTFLLSEACDEDVLSVDEVHGFLSALIVTPAPIVDAEWLELVWGDPQFASDAEAQRLTELMLRLRRETALMLESRRAFEPLIVEVEDEEGVAAAYEGWSYGFMLGVNHHEMLWEKLPSEQKESLMPMAQLSLLNSEEAPDMDDDEYASWVELLPGAVMSLYNFWHSDKGLEAAESVPFEQNANTVH